MLTLTITVNFGFTCLFWTIVRWVCLRFSWKQNRFCAGIFFCMLTLVTACGQSPPSPPNGIAVQDGRVLDRDKRVSELVNRAVVDATGRELGTIEFIARRIDSQDLYAVLHRRGEGPQKQNVIALQDLRWDGEKFLLPEEEPRGPHSSGGGGDSLPAIDLRIETYNPTGFTPLALGDCISPHGRGRGGDC